MFDSWVGKIPWRREWLPTPVFWPGESHGQRSLVGCSPWGHKESDTSEQLSHLPLPRIILLPRASLVAQMVKNLPAVQETQVRSLGWEDLLEEGMATHSSILPGEFHG